MTPRSRIQLFLGVLACLGVAEPFDVSLRTIFSLFLLAFPTLCSGG